MKPNTKGFDVTFFSYLAATKICIINKYPPPNDGAEVVSTIDSIAADGVIASMILANIGHTAKLVCNSIGSDLTGFFVKKYLDLSNVNHSVKVKNDTNTPFIYITSDVVGNRNWFAYTKEANVDLMSASLDAVSQSKMTYIDYYPCIREASERALYYCIKNNSNVMLNISDISNETDIIYFDLCKNGIIQASLDESRVDESDYWVKNLYSQYNVNISIVTLGSLGAIAFDGNSVFKANATHITPLHVHGAGAAFTAGFIAKYLQKTPLLDAINYGCKVGSLSCITERLFEDSSVGLKLNIGD